MTTPEQRTIHARGTGGESITERFRPLYGHAPSNSRTCQIKVIPGGKIIRGTFAGINVDDVTHILARVDRGEPQAVDELIEVVYSELHQMAVRSMKQEQPGHTLQPTALVHEAYLRLVSPSTQSYANRAHFFASAATAIRRILIEHARSRSRLKRGGDHKRVPLDDLIEQSNVGDVELVALDAALEELRILDSKKARLVELRYFAGMSVDEVATVLAVSPSTIAREWRLARAWLAARLTE